ncbi:RagB/SusD family nutrient uptake outer membrane protein [Pedobacter heparinus]|uniref:RagB/SusD family nutrient uptake outer membrane protein n=1 Tax=Pedobacter heparinus TaxID=984 RepID=UPI0029304DDD|nr:RagB/SusD family nutrient uptake outer membrane protein [Pedobacter heparinus]
MKNLNKILLAFAFIFILAGCKDNFINLYPLDEASVENSFKTPDDANLAVMGVYDALQTGSYAQDMALLTELITDNTMVQPSRIGDAGRGDLRELEFFQLTDQNIYIQSRWSGLYTGIARANLLLAKIEQISFSDQIVKGQYIAEAKFLRALFYFDLVRLFGGVPVSLSEIKSASESFALKRVPEAEVYQAIISDLKEAITGLPLAYNSANLGRATNGAAKALLCKVYLTAGSPDLALPLLRELRKAPYTYRLMNTYAAAFDTDNTAESIFEVQYTSSVPNEGNPYPNFFLTNDGTAGKDIYGAAYLGNTGQGINLPTPNMWAAYEPNDSRRTYSIIQYYSKQEAANVFVIYKYRGVPTSANNSEDNIPILRYSDVLLMLAEAINETNKAPLPEAYDTMDEVRKRAGLPVVTRNLGYEEFKLKLLQERRVEFAFENHRWFDLKRFKKAEEILLAKGYAIKPFHLLYPIPRKEVQINPENIPQNLGY